MGTTISVNKADDGNESLDESPVISSIRENLFFPNEILEKILSFLSVRDKLIAREVCSQWMNHINTAADIQETVKVSINSDAVLNVLASAEPVYTRLHFHKLDLTRQSMNFWDAYNEIITHLDFFDCSVIPRRTADCEQADFSLGCPNLRHLGLVNCDKYFLMGGKFIQLHEILHLEKLESLNLSRNKNLTDNILFSILDKTKNLNSLDLSDCVNMVFMRAVHNRFYPARTGSPPPYSDNVLSFHTLCNNFLSTDKAKHMKKFNFGMKFNTTGMELMLSNDEIQWTCANLESSELKASDIKQFIHKFRTTLDELKLGRCKLTSDEIFAANLYKLRELSLYDSRVLSNLQFLKTMPHLEKLVLVGISGFEFDSDTFTDLRNLTELSLNGVKPLGDAETIRMHLSNSFKCVPKLTLLDIGHCTFVNDAVVQEIIKRLKGLKFLNLESTKISDVGLAGISKQDCVQLKSRRLLESVNCVDSLQQIGSNLSELTDLEHLNLSYCCDLGNATWQNSIRFTSLISLNLSNCHTLSKQGLLSIINHCRNMERLNLMHCSPQILTDFDVISAVREKLYRCKEITY